MARPSCLSLSKLCTHYTATLSGERLLPGCTSTKGCIGESLEQNRAGETVPFVTAQIHGAFAGISAAEARRVVLAYEPIWAIGTGLTATPEDADRIIREAIREVLTALYDAETAQALRVQYGGSVKPENMADFIVMPEIDGALVGGASLKEASFSAIVKNALAALAKA